MSDNMWAFSLSSPPPVIHHSTLSQSPPFSSSPATISHHRNSHQSQVTSPHPLPPLHEVFPQHHHHQQIPSPDLFALAHQHLSNRTPGLDDQSWKGSEVSSFYSDHSSSYQNQTTAHIDLQLQDQTQHQDQFSPVMTHHRSGENDTNRLPYNTHTFIPTGVCGQEDTSGPGQDTWGTPPGPFSGGTAPQRWSSVEFSSPSTENFSNNQFFPDSYNDNNPPQVFCSQTMSGPSPHYPQTPTFSSCRPALHHRNQSLTFDTHTFTQVNTDQTFSCCPRQADGYALSSESGVHHPHHTAGHLLQNQTGPIQDDLLLVNTASNLEAGFSPQGGGQTVSSAAQVHSLPAGLIWRGEHGGGSQPQWMKTLQTEKDTDDRLLCTVCKRNFRSLSALKGHMRSHSSFRSAACVRKKQNSVPPAQTSVSMVIPVSVPAQSRGTSKTHGSGQRRCSNPPPATRGTVLYCSLMHQEEQEAVTRGNAAAAVSGDEAGISGDRVVGDDRGHYTPPPMLCPLRPGSGLYCSLTTRRQPSANTIQLHNEHKGFSDLVPMETLTTAVNKPRINVGRGFQADIPPLRHRQYAHSDPQNALLLWSPWDELQKPVTQQRVEALLTLARSSVMPGGGANPEYALHILSECRGDFLLTVEKLMSTRKSSDNHTGVGWSTAETRLLVKSLHLHHKDFSSVQKAVQTKSISQCVEFYYRWKKKLSLGASSSAWLTNVLLPGNTELAGVKESHNNRRGGTRMGAQEEEEEQAAAPLGKKQKTSKEVYFSVLPDRYEPLFEEAEEETPEERRRRKDEKKWRKKRKCKKYRKNVGKALRFSWRCLVAGLQNMASIYTSPLSAVSTVMTEVNREAAS